MAVTAKPLPAFFFRTPAGNEPVREWLRSNQFSDDDRRRIGADIKTVEYGWPIGMPTCRPLRDGLWEVRSRLTDRMVRILFCVFAGRMVLLHGFIKKTQHTPVEEVRLALDRKRHLEAH